MNDKTPANLDAFLATTRDRGEFESLFDHLPDVCFFVKDTQSRLMMGNSALLTLLRQKSFDTVFGRSGADFFPKGIADAFHEDDRTVMQGGTPIHERIELMLDEEGTVSWFSTTKLPLHGTDGRIVGLKGVTRKLGNADPCLHPFAKMHAVIDAIRRGYQGTVDLDALARACLLSPSQFRRNFKRSFGISPLQFILKMRIQAAADLLRTSQLNVTEISLECGFNNPNYFTRQFRHLLGVTPIAYRKAEYPANEGQET